MNAFTSKTIRYRSADTSDHIYQQIKERANAYFTDNHLPKHATVFMAFKSLFFLLCMVAGGYALTEVTSFKGAIAAYGLLTFASVLLSINLGHDAAHHAFTGNKRIDDFIFQTIFALQGLSGYVWQIKHNHSHHVLPNVLEHDTDLEWSEAILLENDPEKAKWYHAYQHIYAPFLYALVSFFLLFVHDFQAFTKKDQANLHFEKIPTLEWVKMISVKILYFAFIFGVPVVFGYLHLKMLVEAWVIVHMVISVFVAFTFFISHHVTQLAYIEAENNLIFDSWIHHQITTTIDFSTQNRLANFIFGGFNLHAAHHIFPEISHQHYPALTEIIKDVLAENGVAHWYKSFSFFEGCASHLQHLKNAADTALHIYNEDNIIGEPAPYLIYEDSYHFNS